MNIDFARKQEEHVQSLYKRDLNDFYRIVAFYLVFIPALFFYGTHLSRLAVGAEAALLFLGLLTATFVEYFIHRGAFHALRAKNPIRKQLAKVHGIHHGLPKLVGFTMLPLISSLVLLTIVTLPFYLLTGLNGQVTIFFLVGLAFGYLNHEWSHHAIHYRTPITPWGRYLIELHDIHHYKSPRKNYGLMCPLWDLVFGTYESKTKTAVVGELSL